MYQRKAEMTLEFQNVIDAPPVDMNTLYGQSTSNDSITITSWRDIWIKQVQENHKKYGPFKDKGIGRFFNAYKHKPVIVAGSGPSLKVNAHELKNRDGIPLVSCLHNFHYFEDLGLEPDFYVTLDSGEVTIDEVSEGGTKTPEEYWAITKNRVLLAFIGTHPDLLAKWQGPVYFFNCPVPDKGYVDAVKALEPFYTMVSTGGNVLGASYYIAKAIFGAGTIAFIGADFSFKENKFHAWDSKYDKNIGRVMKATDVFGNAVKTWQSYFNFKCWFDFMSLRVPQIIINCTEGGIFGAYAEGNIASVKQMGLKEFLDMQNINHHVKAQCEQPDVESDTILF
jgi:hypothetical protein